MLGDQANSTKDIQRKGTECQCRRKANTQPGGKRHLLGGKNTYSGGKRHLVKETLISYIKVEVED